MTHRRRKFSLAHLTLLELPPPALARTAARAGFDFIGLRLIPVNAPGEPRYLLAGDRQLMRETKRALNDTGVGLLDIEVAQISETLDPGTYRPALEAGAELGARFLVTTAWTANPAAVVDCFSRLCDLAQPFGIKVMLEFVSFADLATLDEALDVLRRSRRDNAGLLVDALHCHLAGTNLDDLVRVPPPWLPYAHICDAPPGIPVAREARRLVAREQRLLPGEGAIDVAGIIGRLPEDTILAVEAPNPARVRALGAEEYARRCLSATRGLLK